LLPRLCADLQLEHRLVEARSCLKLQENDERRRRRRKRRRRFSSLLALRRAAADRKERERRRWSFFLVPDSFFLCVVSSFRVLSKLPSRPELLRKLDQGSKQDRNRERARLLPPQSSSSLSIGRRRHRELNFLFSLTFSHYPLLNSLQLQP